MAIFKSEQFFDQYISYTSIGDGGFRPDVDTKGQVIKASLAKTTYQTASSTDTTLNNVNDIWNSLVYEGLTNSNQPVFKNATGDQYFIHYKSTDANAITPTFLLFPTNEIKTGASFELDNAVPPEVIAFSSTTVNGTYTIGDTISITATLNEPVKRAGKFEITLDTGDKVELVSDGTNKLTGSYVVSSGDKSADLTVTAFTTGDIKDLKDNNIVATTLPTGVNNIAGSSDIIIDTSTPTPEPTPEPTPKETEKTIDGMLLKKVATEKEGVTRINTSVETITKERIEDPTTAHKNHADMPVGLVDKGAGIHVSVPINTAFSSEGLEAPQSSLNLKNNLIQDINTLLNKTHESAVTGFLNTFEQTPTFFEQKIILTSSDTQATAEAIIIDGTHNPNPEKASIINALVIDAEKLPEKSEVQVEQVSFIAIKGAINLKTGNVGNTVVIDDAATKKTLFTQGGDDLIHAGKGEYILHGGLKSDTIKIKGKASDYKMEQDYAKVTLTSLTDPKDILELVNVEKLQFSDQTTTINYESAAKMGAVTGTFLQMFDRQPHVNGVKYWTDVLENKDVSLGKMALFFMDSAEQREKIGFDITKADVPTQVEQFYESFLGRPSHTVGKEFWGKHLAEGTLSLVDLATEIINTPEMQSHYEQPEGWDYFI